MKARTRVLLVIGGTVAVGLGIALPLTIGTAPKGAHPIPGLGAVPPPSIGFPNADNTGVPRGTHLTTYRGPSTITRCGVVIDAKIVEGGIDIRAGNGTHSPATPCVVIRNSKINGPVNDGYSELEFGPLVLASDEIDVRVHSSSTPYDLAQSNWYAWRLNIHGGVGGAACDGYCAMHSSYVHDFYYRPSAHLGAFLSNGAYGAPIWLDHSTFVCRIINPAAADRGEGGCTSDVNFLGDFSPITNVKVTGNLLLANPSEEYYCAYTGAHQPAKRYPEGAGIVWKDNTFGMGSTGRCGGSGPVPDWSPGRGNVWSGNRWTDGRIVHV